MGVRLTICVGGGRSFERVDTPKAHTHNKYIYIYIVLGVVRPGSGRITTAVHSHACTDLE